MKLPSEKFLLVCILMVLAIGGAVFAGAAWDYRSTGGHDQVYYLWTLVGLCVLAIALLGASMAVHERARTPLPWVVSRYRPESETIETAIGPGRENTERIRRFAAAHSIIAGQMQALVVFERPIVVTGRPDQIPGPSAATPPAKYGELEVRTYELGNASYRPEMVADVPAVVPKTSHSDRLLCGECGTYFPFLMEPTRPLLVNCPSCLASIGLSGQVLSDVHVWTRCKLCGQYQPILRSLNLTAFICITCGQTNTAAPAPESAIPRQ